MLKRYKGLLPIVALLALASCNNSNKGSNKLILSEYICGSGSDKVIEIYNDSDADIDLNDYYIGIYSTKEQAGSPSVKVKLEGKVEAKKTFVISNTNANSNILSKANQKSDDLSFGGREAVSLMYKNTDLDVIGNIGLRNDNPERAFLRKMWRKNQSIKFNTTDDYLYFDYSVAEKYLGTIENQITEEILLGGPKMVDDYLNMDFYEYTTSYFGTGGAVEVTLQSNVDGDTSYFYFPNETNIEDYMSDVHYDSSKGQYYGKVRYFAVDTPETQLYRGVVDEFGWPAKLNTAKLQNEADHIYVQSNAGESLLETYGRMLGYVFVKNGNDSLMVNFETIKKGYTNITFTFNSKISYLDCPYYNYFVAARKYAEDNQKGLFGEKDPYWDYDNNKSIYL